MLIQRALRAVTKASCFCKKNRFVSQMDIGRFPARLQPPRARLPPQPTAETTTAHPRDDARNALFSGGISGLLTTRTREIDRRISNEEKQGAQHKPAQIARRGGILIHARIPQKRCEEIEGPEISVQGARAEPWTRRRKSARIGKALHPDEGIERKD